MFIPIALGIAAAAAPLRSIVGGTVCAAIHGGSNYGSNRVCSVRSSRSVAVETDYRVVMRSIIFQRRMLELVKALDDK